MCWKIWGFWHFICQYIKQSLGGDVRLRGKESPAQREQERQHRESASTSTSTKRDAGLGVEATLKNRELHGQREL